MIFFFIFFIILFCPLSQREVGLMKKPLLNY